MIVPKMPVPAMTKLPSDYFWPTGAPDLEPPVPFPKLTTDSTTSIISPLTLPRGIAGYFDHIAHSPSDAAALHKHRGNQVYSPLSPGARDPAQQPTSFLSPHLLPFARHPHLQFEQHRSSSLPPETRNRVTSPRAAGSGSHGPDMAVVSSHAVNGAVPSISLASAGHPRSISADAVSAPSQSQMVQRLVKQNARLREAWEAERKYLEVNRARAEEVYKEERALMEADWAAEKTELLAEIERLRRLLGGGSPLAPNGVHSSSNGSFSNLNQRGGSRGSSRISPTSSLSSQRSPVPGVQSDGTVRQNGNPSLPVSGQRAPDLTSPRSPNGPSAPAPDFLKSADASDSESGPIPIVDVQEIDPKLEGIPIKATSVKKTTFTDTGSQDGSKLSSPSGSSPTDPKQSRSPQAKKEQTLQVLAAKEAERLTMHAGHTPNHSLSSLATVASSGTATATSNGGDSTPRMPHESQNIAAAGDGDDLPVPADVTGQFSDVTDRHGNLLSDQPEPIFEPIDDRELKGPLMVRNMPAHDEIFFQALADKLEEVSKDDDAALPAVLKDADPAADTQQPAEQPKTRVNHVSGHGQEAAGSGTSSSGSNRSPSSGNEDDLDVPLKLKKRMNFGAPFGEVR